MPSGDIRLELWDTAGQERYRALTPMYIRGASMVIVGYEITDTNSVDTALLWLTELKSHPNVTTQVLIGNKVDLERTRRVPVWRGQEIARDHNLLFTETSAKTASAHPNEGIPLDTNHILGLLLRRQQHHQLHHDTALSLLRRLFPHTHSHTTIRAGKGSPLDCVLLEAVLHHIPVLHNPPSPAAHSTTIQEGNSHTGIPVGYAMALAPQERDTGPLTSPRD
ncbi:Rab family protein [Pelomyxa schiedti]|nr:Rab family protein [Pelomyxa schiedti]